MTYVLKTYKMVFCNAELYVYYLTCFSNLILEKAQNLKSNVTLT